MNEAYGSKDYGNLPCDECGTCKCIASKDPTGEEWNGADPAQTLKRLNDVQADALSAAPEPVYLHNADIGEYNDARCPGMFEGSAPFWVGFVWFMAGALWWVLRG